MADTPVAVTIQRRTYVLDFDARPGDGDPDVPRRRQEHTFPVAVLRRLIHSCPRVAGLRHELVRDAVKFLPGVKVIMSMKYGRHVVHHEHLVNGLAPAWTHGIEDLTP